MSKFQKMTLFDLEDKYATLKLLQERGSQPSQKFSGLGLGWQRKFDLFDRQSQAPGLLSPSKITPNTKNLFREINEQISSLKEFH